MYLFGAFISGWRKRRRGKIVEVGIMIVIQLLSGGGQKQFRVDIMQAFFVWLFLLFVFTSTYNVIDGIV